MEAAIAAAWDLDVDEDGSGWGHKELTTGRARLSIGIDNDDPGLVLFIFTHEEGPPP